MTYVLNGVEKRLNVTTMRAFCTWLKDKAPKAEFAVVTPCGESLVIRECDEYREMVRDILSGTDRPDWHPCTLATVITWKYQALHQAVHMRNHYLIP